MTFDEYLLATGNEPMLRALEDADFDFFPTCRAPCTSNGRRRGEFFQAMRSFMANRSIARLLDAISLYTGVNAKDPETLVVLDEIQGEMEYSA